MNAVFGGCHLAHPTRLALAAELGDTLDGAWWPHTSSIARELPDLIAALRPMLGNVVDIDLNWSVLDGLPNLDALHWRGNAAVLGRLGNRQRVMTVIGARDRTRLLVVPSQTSAALAVMLLRRAARLPILPVHQHTEAFDVADGIVRSVYAQEPTSTPAPSA